MSASTSHCLHWALIPHETIGAQEENVMPVDGRSLSSAEIEQFYPYAICIIRRGAWSCDEADGVDEEARRIARDHRSGSFNSFHRYHFQRPEQVSEMAGFVAGRRLHRLVPNSTQGATHEEVAAEWIRIAAKRAAILAWARTTRMLQAVVQEYRFERRQGASSYRAHIAASRLIEKADAAIGDPMNHAGVLIEWAEREHRAWFWRCCRDRHIL